MCNGGRSMRDTEGSEIKQKRSTSRANPVWGMEGNAIFSASR